MVKSIKALTITEHTVLQDIIAEAKILHVIKVENIQILQ